MSPTRGVGEFPYPSGRVLNGLLSSKNWRIKHDHSEDHEDA
jgi:hypothetical protein